MKWIALMVLVAGCTPHTKAQNIDLIWHNGQCLLVADGMSIEQAREIHQSWTFEDCKIEISDSTQE